MTTVAPATQTVRGAVAARENQPAQVSPAQAIKHQLDVYAPILDPLLQKSGITRERFISTIGNACRTTPGLLACDPSTVVGAALKAAQLGLEPNDVRNQCWILPYGKQAQFQLGYGGVLELARRAVPGLQIQGHAVYPNDEFDVDYGGARKLTHRPAVALGKSRGGEAYAWYVHLRYPDGGEAVHVLDKEGVEYHRSFSKQKEGMLWTKSYDAAALKSVVMSMRSWLPQATERLSEFDERVLTVDEIAAEDDALALPPVGVDVETGEVQA
jgi:recombination protein RecT